MSEARQGESSELPLWASPETLGCHRDQAASTRRACQHRPVEAGILVYILLAQSLDRINAAMMVQ